MKSRPRVALVGCGRIGQVHAQTLNSSRNLCNWVAVSDSNQEFAQTLAERYGLESASSDSEEIITSPDVDAIIIASSTETHAPYIELAARAGKDIFTEKPIALDLASTDRALNAVRDAGVRLQVGFQRRHDAGYKTAREAIEHGELGAIEMIRDAMRDPEPPTADYISRSGGLFRDMTVHNFDAVRWLMGEDPVELHAMASALTGDDIRAAHDVDTAIVSLKFPSGALASIENSRRSGFGYDVRTEIFGSKAAMLVGESRATPIRRLDASGVHEDHQHFFLARFRDAYREELIAFLGALRSDTHVSVTGEDGRAAMVLAIAAEQSLREGHPVPIHLKEVSHA